MTDEIILIIARAMGPRTGRSWDLLDPMSDARVMLANGDRARAVLAALRGAGVEVGAGWRPIETAPRETGEDIIALTAGSEVVLCCWRDIDDDTSGWCTVSEHTYPFCWTEGVCWERNEYGEPSDPPMYWMPFRAPKAGSAP